MKSRRARGGRTDRAHTRIWDVTSRGMFVSMWSNISRTMPTEIQVGFDGVDEALQWLNDQEEIVVRLKITYPEDKW